MITRLLHTAGSLFVYFCVATLIAQVVLLAYIQHAWQLNRDKTVQVLAIAQGIDLFEIKRESERDSREPSPEQVSYNQIMEARAIKVRHLELREQALANALDQLQSQRQQLAHDTKKYEQLKKTFDEELLAMKEGAAHEGEEEVRATLEKIKPQQAKELLLTMLGNDETDTVVALLSGMSVDKRAKIVGQFKTPDENKKVNEILRLIREGTPKSDLVKKTQEQLQLPQSTGS